MFVKIIEGSTGAWWNNYVGEVFKVRLPRHNDGLFKDTHYMLVDGMPSLPYAVAISKNSCVVIDNENITNRDVSHLLSKED